jgi:hypothetical protein
MGGHAVRVVDNRNACGIFLEKPDDNKTIRKHRLRWGQYKIYLE